MPPQTSTAGNLDPEAVNLAKAIRQSESGGNFSAQGKSGEYGAYQFTDPTWQKMASQAGVNAPLAQATPEQQNQVAYNQIKAWKDKGYNPGQIASMWNAGEGEPNAYTGKFSNGQTSTGTNKFGVKFDVPSYAKSVASAYQTLKQGGQVEADPQNPSSTAAPQPTPSDQQNQDPGFLGNLAKGNIFGAIKNAGDFAFPIIGDVANDIQGKNQKTLLQQLGDAGSSALWFVPGLGEGAGLAEHILAGAGVGYGADVASKLSSGQTDPGSILSPGLGTLTGGVAGGILPKIAGALGKNFTEEGAVNAVKDNLTEAMGATKTGRKFLTAAESMGHDPMNLIAKSGSIPDIVDNKFVTADAQKSIEQRLSQLGEVRSTALDKMGVTVPLEDLRNEALSRVTGQDFPQGTSLTTDELKQIERVKATGETSRMQDQINRVFDDLKGTYGEKLTPSQIESIKEAQTAASGIYKRTGQIGEQNASSIIGDITRSKIEKIAEQSGFPGMKEYNKLMAQHYTALEALKKLDGQPVKGGRLGNILRGHTVAGISAMGVNAAGGGFLGTLAGGLGGEAISKLFSKIMGDTSLTNPLRQKILERIEQENPEIVQKLLDFSKQSGKVAPVLAPKASQVGKVTNSLIAASGLVGGKLAASK